MKPRFLVVGFYSDGSNAAADPLESPLWDTENFREALIARDAIRNTHSVYARVEIIAVEVNE